jgi:ribosomal RNA-processing protein 1
MAWFGLSSVSTSFYQCLSRGIYETELHRIDKYYMLVRKYVNASFRLLIREEWASVALTEYTDILTGNGGPLKSVPCQGLELYPN